MFELVVYLIVFVSYVDQRKGFRLTPLSAAMDGLADDRNFVTMLKVTAHTATIVHHGVGIRTRPSSLTAKLSSDELCLSSRDQHLRAVVSGRTASMAAAAGLQFGSALVNLIRATYKDDFMDGSGDVQRRAAIGNAMAGAALGSIALGCHFAGRAAARLLPRRRREHLKPKEQHLLRGVETVRDAHRTGSGSILPPAGPRGGLPVVDTFICRSPHDGSRWRATRIS